MAVIARMRRQKYLLYNLSSKVFVSPLTAHRYSITSL